MVCIILQELGFQGFMEEEVTQDMLEARANYQPCPIRQLLTYQRLDFIAHMEALTAQICPLLEYLLGSAEVAVDFTWAP